MYPYTLHPIGDDVLLIQFISDDKSKLLSYIHYLTDKLLQLRPQGVVEIVPAFESIAIYYNAFNYTYQKMCRQIEPFLHEVVRNTAKETKTVSIPVCYDEAVGLDLVNLAKHHNLTTQDLINIHCSTVYTAAVMGFLPGFPYLTGLDKLLWTPRIATPRTHVPKGAVGIGGSYTGIYSLPSPGGWNIIGQTPLSLFNNEKENPFLLQPGDQVTFYPITLNDLEGWL